MICNVLKEEIDCIFMAKQGCTFNGGHCEPVVEACDGCDHIAEIDEDFYCRTSASPASKWNHGSCNYATHVVAEISNGNGKKVNPLKASKRAAGRR